MKKILVWWAVFLLAASLDAEADDGSTAPDAQQILNGTIDRLSHGQVLTYSFRHQGPKAYALTTGWAKVVLPSGDTRGRFTQARIEGRTGTGEWVQVAIDKPDIYALDVERKTLWHSTPRKGGFALYNRELLAPVFLLKALSRARSREEAPLWVGRQVVGQTPCQVIDYRSARMDLRVWIGEEDALPRRIEAYSEAHFGHGALIIALDDWQTHVPVEEGDFELELPEGFERVEYEGRAYLNWD